MASLIWLSVYFVCSRIRFFVQPASWNRVKTRIRCSLVSCAALSFLAGGAAGVATGAVGVAAQGDVVWWNAVGVAAQGDVVWWK